MIGRPKLLAVRLILIVAVTSAVLLPQYAGGQGRLPVKSAPHDGYWYCFEPFYDGDFREALAAFRDAARSRIITPTQAPWIDAICYHAMIGECHYQMGNLTDALDQYSSALKVFLANSNWMLRVEFDQQPITAQQSPTSAITWGTSSRNSSIGRYPKTFSSFRGRLDNTNVIKTGGVIEPPEFNPIYVPEIIRCTTLAMSRRREIMGPACEYDPLTGQLLGALSRRPGQPSHWSQCWVELELGLAYASSNQVAQAISELQKSLLVADRFDHPLTCQGLLELGRLAFEQAKYEAAITYFHEATLSGAHFDRYDVMEEAFRLGAEAHLLAGKQGVYPPLVPAAISPTTKRSKVLHAGLLTSSAEHHCAAGQTPIAANHVTQARNILTRRSGEGLSSCRLNYQAARIALQGGDAKTGGAALSAALAFQKTASKRLFQIGLVDSLYRGGGVTDRQADLLFAEVLREPTPTDWLVDPLDALAVRSTPHPLPYEHWFELALNRNEQDKAIHIAERIRRHRFFVTQPLGGRMLALRWILEGATESLSQQALLQRQDLLVRYPNFAELSRRATELKTQLQALPISPTDESQQKQQNDLLAELAKVSGNQESLLQNIALERVPSEYAFPPLREIADIRRELPEGTLVFYYCATSQNVHAFALTKDRYGTFTVAAPGKVKADVSDLLRQIGNQDRTQPVAAEDLKTNGWKSAAQRLVGQLTNNTKQTDWARYRELIIIPDGVLWYLPFEALPVPTEQGTSPLLFALPVRYAPTLSLAMPQRRGIKPVARTAVVSGKLLPRDSDAQVASSLDGITAALPGSVPIRNESRAGSAVFTSAFERLLVLKEHEDCDKAPFGWSPLALDSGKPGGTLGDWMQLPFGNIDQIVLPGFHTPAEYALKRGGTGDELFLAACGLMASGCRTIMLSRWRVGGQSTIDLMREFVQELPHESASAAWRRSVQLAASRTLDPALEGRLKANAATGAITAEHPFFWSGYMLIDSGAAPAQEASEKQ